MSAKTNKARYLAWEARKIAGAVEFTAVTFLGFPEGYDCRRAPSLERARHLREEILAEYEGENYGRGIMIYAVTADHLTIHVE